MQRLFFTLVTFFISIIFCLPHCYAGETARPELTLKDAIELALKNSNSLKASEFNVEKLEEQRDNASRQVDFIKTGPGGAVMPEAESTFYRAVQADLNWRVQKKQLEAQEDKVVLDTYQKYAAVLQAGVKLGTAEAARETAAESLRVALAGQRAGVKSQAETVAAQASAESAKKDLEAANEALDKAYAALNRIIDLSPGDRPVLIDEINFAAIKTDDIDVEEERAIANSKDVWILKQNIDVQKIDLNLTTVPYSTSKLTQYSDYDIEKYDVDIAEQNVYGAERSLREQLRSLYHDIRLLEEQHAAAEESLKAVEERLRVAKAMYSAGMNTKMNLKEAELEVIRVKNNIAAITYQHASLCATFRLLTGREVVYNQDVK